MSQSKRLSQNGNMHEKYWIMNKFCEFISTLKVSSLNYYPNALSISTCPIFCIKPISQNRKIRKYLEEING